MENDGDRTETEKMIAYISEKARRLDGRRLRILYLFVCGLK